MTNIGHVDKILDGEIKYKPTRASLGILDAPPVSPGRDGAFLENRRAIREMTASLEVDPVTGYLEATNTSQPNSFNVKRKVEFIKLATILWPNLQAVCDEVGISRQTLNNHRAVDVQFENDLADIRERKMDRIEGKTFEFAEHPKQVIDRMAVLRAYRGDIYNPKQTISVEHKITQEVAYQKREALAGVIDGEIVEVSGSVLHGQPLLEQPQVSSQPPIVGVTVSPSVTESGKNSPNAGGEQIPLARDPLSEITDGI
jgi:hypothetical protein